MNKSYWTRQRFIDAARKLIERKGKTEIDDNARYEIGDDGIWIGSWTWIPNDDLETIRCRQDPQYLEQLKNG